MVLDDIQAQETNAREFYFRPNQTQPSTLEEFLRDIQERYVFLPHEGKATQLADALAVEFKAEVQLVDTDVEYYSDHSLLRTARDGIYFISRERPAETAEETKRLLKYNRLRYELANASRIEKASRKAQDLGAMIERIISEYKENHAGKEPSLRKIAVILNQEGALSPGGKMDWAANSVKRILDKIKELDQEAVGNIKSVEENDR